MIYEIIRSRTLLFVPKRTDGPRQKTEIPCPDEHLTCPPREQLPPNLQCKHVDTRYIRRTCHPTTHNNPTFVVDDVVHYCVSNMPGSVPHTSTIALTNVTLPYIKEIASLGLKEAIKNNSSLKLGLNTYKGRVTHLENDFQIWTEDYLIDLKENILKTKLDVLFQYITEEQAVQQFQEYKSDLDLYQMGYNTDHQLYLDKTNNTVVKNDLNTSIFKLADIKEEIKNQLEIYQKTKDKRPFKDIALIYVKRMMPLLDSIRDLKYKYIVMDYDEENNTNILTTRHYIIKDVETNTNPDDEPKLIANKK